MEAVREVENLVYQESTGNVGMLDLYFPVERDGVPLLIFFHGGGLESGDKRDDKGMLREIASRGIAVVSANYRMYPDAKFPQYVEDAAKAVEWSLSHVREFVSYRKIYVGGVSAGAYLSMMLHFQPEFLAECGVEEKSVAGYIFDAGQPTVHYNILRERGKDPKSVRVDEAAPLYYLEGECEAAPDQKYLILVSDHDIVGRKEQNELLIRTMETHHYKREQIEYRVMEGYGHVEYVDRTDEKGSYPYAGLLSDFMMRASGQWM